LRRWPCLTVGGLLAGFARGRGGSLRLARGSRDAGIVGRLGVGSGEVDGVVAVDARKRLVSLETPVARPGESAVWAAALTGEDRRATPLDLLLLVAVLGLLCGELRLRADINAPSGEACRKARVLALAADCERQLVIGDDDGGLLGLVIDEHLANA